MPHPRRFREVFPGGEKAAGHARRVLARWLAGVVPGDRLGDIQLLVTEIVANCVRHGRVGEDGEIDLLVKLAGDVARVEVRDTGIQVDPRLKTPDLSGGGGFGMVLVESLACGTPVVTTTHSAPKEVVEVGVTGELCEPHDPAGLAVACVRGLELTRKAGTTEACRASAEPFDWDRGLAPLVEGLYTGDSKR